MSTTSRVETIRAGSPSDAGLRGAQESVAEATSQTLTYPGQAMVYSGTSLRSANMRANRRRDTAPELEVRRRIHSRGLRYRCDLRLSVDGVTVRPDVVFTRQKVAVFIDGCFWHACSEHGSTPRVNSAYWGPKLAKNIARDELQTKALTGAGWWVIRAWEHEAPEQVADVIERAVRSQSTLR